MPFTMLTADTSRAEALACAGQGIGDGVVTSLAGESRRLSPDRLNPLVLVKVSDCALMVAHRLVEPCGVVVRVRQIGSQSDTRVVFGERPLGMPAVF
jgi:hypothetical protein